MDIIHLRGSYTLSKELNHPQLELTLNSCNLFGFKLSLASDTLISGSKSQRTDDTLYLVAKSQIDWDQWTQVLYKQCLTTINSAAVSEFTRLQDERKQMLEDEENRRIEEVQKRFASVRRFHPSFHL